MKEYLGIELGSTRIKAVLIGEDHAPIVSGEHTWENVLIGGLWTYSEEVVWQGLRAAYAQLARAYEQKTGKPITQLSGMGVSAMMHGYLALDKNGKLLSPFRTWRNTNTGEAAEKLTQLFGTNIPMRWSVAHLYQAVLNEEEHVKDIALLTTLAGYVHYKLTGQKVLGIGDASGMFPIDSATGDYDKDMLEKFDALIAAKRYCWKLSDILPEVLSAGTAAGELSAEGALRLDPSERLQTGILLCPPEGDAGTGMVATNSVKEKTGNVSAGTSVFAMAVLDQPLKELHTEIDMVTTPDGAPVAMVHCNNCTSDLNAWTGLFAEVLELFDSKISFGELMTELYQKSIDGDGNCGGLMSYNYLSGEPVTGFHEGRPLFARSPDAKLTLANFMKTQIYSALAALALGFDILSEEGVVMEKMCGQGGFFKTPEVGQRAMSAALHAPVTVLQNAGEGGAWGIALLTAFCDQKQNGDKTKTLSEFLEEVFAKTPQTTLSATASDKADFAAFLSRYKRGLTVEKIAAEVL